MSAVNANAENLRIKRTLSIASLSSSVTLIACVPGGSVVSSSMSSLNSWRNCSWFCPISCASWGLPAATCCRIGSSIWGCCCTSWRSCWKCGLFRRKSRLPRASPPAAPAPPARAPRPAPCSAPAAWAAASNRLTGSSPAVACAEGAGCAAPWPAAAAACRCSCWTFSGIP